MSEIPHFAFPFHFATEQGVLQAATTEQDEPAEVADCVEVLLRTPLGFRDELPEFGIPDLALEQQPINVSPIRAGLAEWEPRADASISSQVDTIDELIGRIRVELEAPENP